MHKDNGGFAFPGKVFDHYESKPSVMAEGQRCPDGYEPTNTPHQGVAVYKDNQGMTLRDYFAGRVIAGMMGQFSVKDLVSCAYEIADAMIAERNKQNKEEGK